VCTLAGYVLWTVGLRVLDPSRAVAYLYGVPVVAVAVGALTLGESVTAWLLVGGLLVVGGVALAQ
jgi:drug/metabolite transporter (DMT)-like permease